jgi:hypothetical protein
LIFNGSGKKAQSLKGQILSCQQAIPQNHPTWGHLELSSNMKTKGGPQYVGAPRGRKMPADESSAREIVGSSR